MHGVVLVTDHEWYEFLSRQPELDEANFWRPSDTEKPGLPGGHPGPVQAQEALRWLRRRLRRVPQPHRPAGVARLDASSRNATARRPSRRCGTASSVCVEVLRVGTRRPVVTRSAACSCRGRCSCGGRTGWRRRGIGTTTSSRARATTLRWARGRVSGRRSQPAGHDVSRRQGVAGAAPGGSAEIWGGGARAPPARAGDLPHSRDRRLPGRLCGHDRALSPGVGGRTHPSLRGRRPARGVERSAAANRPASSVRHRLRHGDAGSPLSREPAAQGRVRERPDVLRDAGQADPPAARTRATTRTPRSSSGTRGRCSGSRRRPRRTPHSPATCRRAHSGSMPSMRTALRIRA